MTAGHIETKLFRLTLVSAHLWFQTLVQNELTHLSTVNLQYEPRTVKGKPPPARGYHATILADSRLFVFGGVSL